MHRDTVKTVPDVVWHCANECRQTKLNRGWVILAQLNVGDGMGNSVIGRLVSR